MRWGVDLIIAFCPKMIPRADEITIDFRVFLFAIGLSILIGVLFGFFPALRAARLDLNSIVKQAPAEGGRPRSRYRDLLLVFEIAFALVLAVGAALLMNSFVRLANVDPGFKRENILIWQVSLNQQGSTPRALVEEILKRVGALPRVAASGIVAALPLAGEGGSVSFRVKDVLGQSRPDLGDTLRDIDDMRVSAGYFRAMGLQFLRGGTFSETAPDTQGELIVSESLARKLWPGEDPIGKRLNLGSRSNPWVPVVGVVKDVRQHGLQQEPSLTLYRLYRGGGYFSLLVQAKSDALSLIPDIRRRILSVDKTALIYRVQSMEDILSASVSQPRFYAILFALFATLAISLAAIGVYGVASYSISFRTREFGIRIALGARPREIMKMVLAQEMVKAIIGVALGIFFALALTRFLTSLLFEVEPGDPLTMILATAGITSVALLAGYIPARRATKIDPMVALKEL